LVDGKKAPFEMAELAKGQLRKKLTPLVQALRGTLDDEDRWLLKAQMSRLEQLDEDITSVEAKIDSALASHDELRVRLTGIPGVSQVLAAVIIAEVGTHVDAFPTDRQLAKWAGLCPGNNESAGRSLSGTTTKGNEYLRTALVEGAQAAIRKKG